MRLFLTVVICYSNFTIFRGLSFSYINLGKFKSRSWKQNEVQAKRKKLFNGLNLTFKINMDFIQGCIVTFKRLLIPEVIILSLRLVILKQ